MAHNTALGREAQVKHSSAASGGSIPSLPFLTLFMFVNLVIVYLLYDRFASRKITVIASDLIQAAIRAEHNWTERQLFVLEADIRERFQA